MFLDANIFQTNITDFGYICSRRRLKAIAVIRTVLYTPTHNVSVYYLVRGYSLFSTFPIRSKHSKGGVNARV